MKSLRFPQSTRSSSTLLGFTLIEALIVIAATTMLVGPVFLAFITLVRLERAVAKQNSITEQLVALDHAWRHDVHGVQTVTVASEGADHNTTVVTFIYPVRYSRPACSYRLTPRSHELVDVVRHVDFVDSSTSHSTVLLSGAAGVTYVAHPAGNAHELKIVLPSLHENAHKREEVRILATTRLEPLALQYRRVNQ
jgi:hypothetical protein